MRVVADLHTHTVASGHAYSTVNELATAAAAKGLAALAITDHGPALPGAPHMYHFGAMRFIPREIAGVRILTGVEANILDVHGGLDLPEFFLGKLDFVMAGLHEGCGFDNAGIDRNTTAVIQAMSNPLVKAISHPGNPIFPLHLEVVVEAAVKTGVALEINNASFSFSRKGSRPNCEALARLLATCRAPVAVGSDAHIAQGVGVFDEALAVLSQAGVAEEQLVNSSMERLLAFLGLDE
jgi:putative hydrolase